MKASALEDRPPNLPATCSHCGANEKESGFDLPLCVQCRDLLCRRPFPPWIRVSCAIVLAACVFAAARSINSFRAGIAFERGKHAERQGRFAAAADDFRLVVERFPDSTLALARLGITLYRAGQLEEAAHVLNQVQGRKLSSELADEVKQAIQAIRMKQVIRNTRPSNINE